MHGDQHCADAATTHLLYMLFFRLLY